MSFLACICKFLKGKAEFKTGYKSELDSFYHKYNEERKDWLANPLRVKELNKHQAIFNKRDYLVDKKSETLWKDF
jgi:hypothetical protein